MNESRFEGTLITYIGWTLFGIIITTITLGICYPWALCKIYGWKINNTVVEGRRLRFIGTPMSLFWQWVKWLFFTVITFGIYGFWLGIKLEKWKAKNTIFD